MTDYGRVARAALTEFGIVPAEVTLILVSENLTFRAVDDRTGNAYVLRLHRPGYHDVDELISERQWLRALATSGVSVPSPVQAPDGREFVAVPAGRGGELRQASMSRWVEGEIAGSVLRRHRDPVLERHYFAQLGATMAAMHDQASGWEPPMGFRRKRWDIDGLLGTQPHWGRFWEYHAFNVDEQRTLLRARDEIVKVLQDFGYEPSAFSMIHADMNHDNLVVDGDRVTVIDFDDAAFGWHLYDMAVALNGCYDPLPGASEAAFIDGYRSIRMISDGDLALLPMFRLVRGMAVLGWKGERPEVEWEPGRLERLRSRVLALAAVIASG